MIFMVCWVGRLGGKDDLGVGVLDRTGLDEEIHKLLVGDGLEDLLGYGELDLEGVAHLVVGKLHRDALQGGRVPLDSGLDLAGELEAFGFERVLAGLLVLLGQGIDEDVFEAATDLAVEFFKLALGALDVGFVHRDVTLDFSEGHFGDGTGSLNEGRLCFFVFHVGGKEIRRRWEPNGPSSRSN